jgi:hypothetical protein
MHLRVDQPPCSSDLLRPVFVLATARSYTSVVTMMIGQHPQLMGLPELKLFAYPTMGELEASLPPFWLKRGITHRSPGLVRTVAQLEFGDQQARSLSSANEWLHARSHWSGVDVLDYLIERASPRLVIEKSPENVQTDTALNRMASAYPRARYLHLTRHPVTTLRSVQEYWKRVVPEHSVEDQPMSVMVSWIEAQCRILRFAANLPANRYLRIKSEDVLNDSWSKLKLIAAWLGIRTDDEAIEAMLHPEASPFAQLGPVGSGVIGGNDPDFLRDPVPRAVETLGTIDRPPDWIGHEQLWQLTIDIGNHLGYP